VLDVDHLVYATPDLRAGIEEIEGLMGVRATEGGRHPGAGTRNALVALGEASYLEIIGPDPEQETFVSPRLFGIDGLTSSRLITWAAKAQDLDRLAAIDLGGGIRVGEVAAGSRQTPEGVSLAWRYTNPRTMVAGGIVPFFIDWGKTRHPARTAGAGARLIDLRAEHPEPELIQKMLAELGLELRVSSGPRAALVASIECPRGRIELR
jgi:hypothetical protein